jgi:hypothetical protein
LTYTLIGGIDLLEAVGATTSRGASAPCRTSQRSRFTLYDRSEQLPGGRITFIELEDAAYRLTVGGERGPNFHCCAVPDRA